MGRLLPDTSMPGSSARLDTQDADGIRDYKGACRCLAWWARVQARFPGATFQITGRLEVPDAR